MNPAICLFSTSYTIHPALQGQLSAGKLLTASETNAAERKAPRSWQKARGRHRQSRREASHRGPRKLAPPGEWGAQLCGCGLLLSQPQFTWDGAGTWQAACRIDVNETCKQHFECISFLGLPHKSPHAQWLKTTEGRSLSIQGARGMKTKSLTSMMAPGDASFHIF